MSEIAIRVENLSKLYHIGKLQQRHDTLRDALMGLNPLPRIRRMVRREEPDNSRLDDTIWALKDVSFEVQRGKVVGIIGRNGAGKSTLLKVLSQITEPTEGRAEIHGRVGSLLEVGTGFHPELTGRENIYLSGALLGMHKAEIDRRFDEIVEFSGVEKFIDTPIKRYSSGMNVRLGFAVAAHLEPEILLIDEVLAVGDAQFQKKCLGKMGEVAGQGRTVLFVSHNMVAMQSLCERAIWLNNGQIAQGGPADQVVSSYLNVSLSHSQADRVWEDPVTAPGNELVRLHRAAVRPENGSPSDPITMDTPLAVEIEYWNLLPGARLHVTLHFFTEQQIVAFTSGSAVTDPVWSGRPFPAGLYRSTCQIPGQLLNSGVYRVLLLVVQDGSRIIYRHQDLLSFEVQDLAERRMGGWYGREPGTVRPSLQWRTEQVDGDHPLDHPRCRDS